MSEYVITTDNNSDLPEEYLKDHGVGCMYLSYSMDGKNYTHGNFLPEHEFYEAMRNGSMPTTAQVNPENAKALLEPYLKEGKDILTLLVDTKLAKNRSEARRLVTQGGVSVNDVKVTDFAKVFTSADFDEDGVLLIKKGKKGYHQVKAD